MNQDTNATNFTATSSFSSTSRVAGFVGMLTGCGALIALLLFLPLPARLQLDGMGPEHALQLSFYIVAIVAFILSLWCWIGLRNLGYEEERCRRVVSAKKAGRLGSRQTGLAESPASCYGWLPSHRYCTGLHWRICRTSLISRHISLHPTAGERHVSIVTSLSGRRCRGHAYRLAGHQKKVPPGLYCCS